MTAPTPAKVPLFNWIVAGTYFVFALRFAWLCVQRGGALGPAMLAIGLAILGIFHFFKNGMPRENLKADGPTKMTAMLWALWATGAILLTAGAISSWHQ